MITYLQQFLNLYKFRKIPPQLSIALLELGETSITGSDHNLRILEYLRTVDLDIELTDEIPWCAAFANWCLKEAGLPTLASPLARSFLNYGEEIQEPTLGCLTVLSRGSHNWQGHVGFYLDHSGGFIRLIGGNQLNRVGVNNYKESSVLSYRRTNP